MLAWLLLNLLQFELVQSFHSSSIGSNSVNKLYLDKTASSLEEDLLTLLRSNQISGRGSRNTSPSIINSVQQCIATLENYQLSPAKKITDEVDGCWKLLYTTSPGTNSPIQKTFTGIDSVSIYQVVNIFNRNDSFLQNQLPDVSNIICFGTTARLRVTALASTASFPLIIPRKGDGKIFGLNVFGISSNTPPRNTEERIDFAFQEALFEFSNQPITIPYPVPFKLLGDEAKGWIDNTYVSKSLRIARGNKGTTFVLEKVSGVDQDATAKWASKKLKPNLQTSTNKSYQQQSQPLQMPKEIGWVNPFNFMTNNAKSKLSASQSVRKRPIKYIGIIFPAQLGTKDDYTEFCEVLSEASNQKLTCYVAPLLRYDWPIGLIPSFFSSDYIAGTLRPSNTLRFYYNKVDEAICQALQDHVNNDVRFVLIGHSIGGWVARSWLSEWSDVNIRSRVSELITLGSPHNPPPLDSVYRTFDQTRGLLTYINEKFPGAYEKNVMYTSVIGASVKGDLNINPSEFSVEPLVAGLSYLFLSGDSSNYGDGIIPVATAQLLGAKVAPIEDDIKHSNYVPTPLSSIKLPVKWYGTKDIVEQWLPSTLR